MPISMQYGASRSVQRPIYSPLWNNADPTAAFASQSVSVDLSGYKYFAVLFRFSTTGNYHLPLAIYTVDETSKVIFLNALGATTVGGRAFSYSIANKAITFQDGNYGNTTNNNYGIPVQIYGVS